MTRTTIMADERVLGQLKALARQRGVSFSLVVREALEEKARQARPQPTSVGSFSSTGKGVSGAGAEGRTPPRSWR